ncbi:hypothetical protein RRG08_009886 [Elysia crispata]|uniref:Uncharacterized protein n=1 Tax=Elysia crispata TaxID=231223 RepID=A0AAE0Z486_9GAST|nr:hypothetical protein RRG08_009886 [Elysia crispata]
MAEPSRPNAAVQTDSSSSVSWKVNIDPGQWEPRQEARDQAQEGTGGLSWLLVLQLDPLSRSGWASSPSHLDGSRLQRLHDHVIPDSHRRPSSQAVEQTRRFL